MGRVLLLVLVAGFFAYLDGRYFAIDPSPGSLWQSLAPAALLTGAVFCFAALFAEGALPAGPWSWAKWCTGILATALCALLLGLLQYVLPAERTIVALITDNAPRPPFYLPIAARETEPVIVAIVPALALIATLALMIFAPACAMRFGWRGLVRQSWRAFGRHWKAIGLRACALVPIGIVALPIISYWLVEEWSVGLFAPPDQVARIQFAADMCQTVGPNGIAYSGFASTALFGLFLWWIGRSTGVLLDRRD